MINRYEVAETNEMIEKENLDVRTITLGISLLDCIDSDLKALNEKIYNKIYEAAKNLVETGEDIAREYGIPIVNKRISVTPIALIGGAACKTSSDFATIAKTLDDVAKKVGVNFIGGYSALVQKGFAAGDEALIRSIPEALSVTEHICSSVNIGSTKAGINMDAVKLMGQIIKESAEVTANKGCIGPAKLVVFCNAPEDNPFMAGAFHGVGEPDCVINVGVSGPGVVRSAISKIPDANITEIADVVLLSKLQEWVNLLLVRLQIDSMFRLVLLTFPLLQLLQLVTLLPIFLKKWDLNNAVHTAQQLVLHSLMTR